MRAVVCKKMPKGEGKVVVCGSVCPYCNRQLSRHKTIEDVPQEHDATDIELNEVDNHGSVQQAA